MAKGLILVDTNILIESYRGDKIAKEHLEAIRGRIAVSVITVMELYRGCKTKERKTELAKQIKAYYVVNIDNAVSERAMQIFKHYISSSQDVYIADCLIAATAMENKMKLFTKNKQDFNFIKDLVFYHP